MQDKAKAKKQKEPAADISKYLRGAGLMETRYVRKVSSLCAQTYYMHKLTVCSLKLYKYVAVIAFFGRWSAVCSYLSKVPDLYSL